MKMGNITEKCNKRLLKHWRPISILNVDYKTIARIMSNSILNVDYKTIARIMSNRIKHLLPNIISNESKNVVLFEEI
jgi:transposase